MDKTIQKILTMSFVAFSAIIGLSVSLLLKTFAGSFAFMARLHNVDFVKHGVPVVAALAVFASLQFNKNVLAWGEDVALAILALGVAHPLGKLRQRGFRAADLAVQPLHFAAHPAQHPPTPQPDPHGGT